MGFNTKFVPVPNCVGNNISVEMFSFLGFGLWYNYQTNTVRTDGLYVKVRMTLGGVSLTPRYLQNDFLAFSSGDEPIFVKAYLDSEAIPRIKLQTRPFIGCDIPYHDYEQLRLRTAGKPNLGYMEFNIKKLGGSCSISDISLIGEALKSNCLVSTFEPVMRSQSEGFSGDSEAIILGDVSTIDFLQPKPAGKVLPSMLDTDSVLIRTTRDSEELTYAERVGKYLKGEDFVVPGKYWGYREEFLRLAVPEPHQLSPDDVDVILEEQSRPKQLVDYLETVLNCFDASPKCSTFQKGEVYGPKIPAPRNICNPIPQIRVATARFIRPMSNYMKAGAFKHIYAFGDAQYVDDCIQRVVDQSRGRPILETDYTKLDANIGRFFRQTELYLGERLLREEYHEEWRVIHRAQYADKFPRTAKGAKMDLGDSRRSGEGGTSFFNSIPVNAFAMYCTFREMGEDPDESFSSLGIVGGDDGLLTGADPETMISTCSALGLPIKVVVRQVGESISFLGMVRPVPCMSLYSCDVVRFVTKVSFSHVKNVPWRELAYRKCEPYARMYPNTPLIGSFTRAVVRLLREQGFSTHNRFDDLCSGAMSYNLKMWDGAFFNTGSSETEVEILEDYIARALKLSIPQLRDVCSAYDNAKTFDDFPTGFIKYSDLEESPSPKFQCLYRDLFITSESAQLKLSTLPTTSFTGVSTKINNEKEFQNEQQTSTGSSAESTTDGDFSSSTEAPKKSKKKRIRKKRASPAITSWSSVSEM